MPQPSQGERVFEITDEMVERAAPALLGELTAGVLRRPTAAQDKDTLRLAVRRILAAASDPMWGKR
jgi:hypothetical protein